LRADLSWLLYKKSAGNQSAPIKASGFQLLSKALILHDEFLCAPEEKAIGKFDITVGIPLL